MLTQSCGSAGCLDPSSLVGDRAGWAQVRVHVSTTLQRLVLISDRRQDEPILAGRQKSAFPPNFIHSIDSSHMMMTAIACKQAGLCSDCITPASCPLYSNDGGLTDWTGVAWLMSSVMMLVSNCLVVDLIRPLLRWEVSLSLSRLAVLLHCMDNLCGNMLLVLQQCPWAGAAGQLTHLCPCAGLTFAGVHDSFWTHAATVPTLNRLLREKFVELYSKPILQDLELQFKEQYPEAKLPPLPEQGELDIEEVRRAPYFFS